MRLIDADKLDFPIEYGKFKDSWEAGFDCALHTCIDVVNDAPTIDPVKHGHWVLNGDPRDKWYNCSVCGKHGHDKITNYGFDIETILSDYCPHCGAKMDEVYSNGN